jgi:hypothetical protein
MGGRGGIRTHGQLAPTLVFKTSALVHYATLPGRRVWESNPFRTIHPAGLANLCLTVRPTLQVGLLYQLNYAR